MKFVSIALASLCLAVPAFADVTVSFPVQGAQLMSPFLVQASASACQSQPVSIIAYSLDDNPDTIVKSTSLSASVTADAGLHILRVKTWGNRGALCQSLINVQVLDAIPAIPANVAASANLQSMTTWVGEHDTATSGSSNGVTSLLAAATAQVNGQTRQFSLSYANSGGQRFHVSFPANQTATHFVYDTYLMINSACGSTSCGKLGAIEMDMNQVLANGNVVIYGVQCDGWSQTWDYTVNNGTPSQSLSTWRHTNVTCDPSKWTKDVWHHIQLSYARDAAGNVTYDRVTLDSQQNELNNAFGPSLFALNWAPVLLTNFQLDGNGSSGSQTVEMANTTVYAW